MFSRSRRLLKILSGCKNYYVDFTGGIDANNGLTPVTAWKTIAKVNAIVFSAGSRILFKTGETWAEKLTIPASNLYFGSYGGGAQPIITGSGARDHAIYSTGKNNITIDGIHCQNTTWEVMCIESGTGIAVKNCTISNAAAANIGILVIDSTSILISHNTVSNVKGNGIGINGASSNGEIRYNDVSVCGVVTDDRSCISVFNAPSNIRVHHNICHDATNAGAVGIRGIIIDTCGNNVNYVYQNICHHCDGSGIYIYRSNNQLVHYNICYSNGSVANWNDGIKFQLGTGGYCYSNTCYGNRNSAVRCNAHTNVTIKDNIGWQLGNSCLITEAAGATTHVVDYNDWFGVANEYSWNGIAYANEALFFAATGQGEHDITVDPLCISNADYHLQPGSPCINTGIDVGLTFDFDGVAVGNPPEIGAYEKV